MIESWLAVTSSSYWQSLPDLVARKQMNLLEFSEESSDPVEAS